MYFINNTKFSWKPFHLLSKCCLYFILHTLTYIISMEILSLYINIITSSNTQYEAIYTLLFISCTWIDIFIINYDIEICVGIPVIVNLYLDSGGNLFLSKVRFVILLPFWQKLYGYRFRTTRNGDFHGVTCNIKTEQSYKHKKHRNFN